jgi:HK97 family phage major capsid protein
VRLIPIQQRHAMTYTTLSSARAKAAPTVRTAMLLMAHKGNLIEAESRAVRSFPASVEIQNYFKSAVSAGTTSDPAWAAPLAAHSAVIAGFVELLRSASVLGRLKGLRSAPFDTRTLIQSAGSQGAFVAEGHPSPITAQGFATTQLPPAKFQCTAIFTSELVRVWTQASEDQVHNDMIAGGTAGLDRAFLDPTIGLTSTPASITHGITAHASTGATVAAITADAKTMMAEQIAAGNDLSATVWIMTPRSALHLSTLRDTAGQLAFPTVTVLGGTLFGLPVLVSGAVALAGSPNDSYIVLLNPKRVLLADDGLLTLDVTGTAAVQLNDSPSPGDQPLASLWQLGLTAVRMTRYINWSRASDDAVSLLRDVQY